MWNSSCVSSNWRECGPSLHTETVLHSIYTLIGAFSVPTTILVLFVVLTRSSRTTGRYKYLTALQLLWMLLSDIQLFFSMCPLWVMQRQVAYTLGFADNYGISSKFQLMTYVFTFLQLQAATYFCIFYRHQTIISYHSFFRIHRRIRQFILAIIFNLFISAYSISMYFSFADQEYLRKHEPDLIWIENKRSFLYRPPHASTFHVIAVFHLFFLTLFAFVLAVFAFSHMMLALSSPRNFVSQNTLRQQRTAIRSLALQCAVPATTVFITISLQVVGTVFFEPLDYNITSYANLTLSPNSLATCAVILYTTPDYKRLLTREKNKVKPGAELIMSGSGVHSRSHIQSSRKISDTKNPRM